MKILARLTAFLPITAAMLFVGFRVDAYCQSKVLNTDKLVRESEVIVQGRVGQLKTEWTPNHDRIQTRVAIAIDQTMKGSVPGNQMTVIVPGGEIDGVGEWYSHTVQFGKDEEVVLFAKQTKAGTFRIADGVAGKFTITKDEHSGSRIIPNIGTLESFTSKIQSAVKKQQAAIDKEE